MLAGSVLVDLWHTVPHLPARGSDVVATGFSARAGGGWHVLRAAVRAGLPAALAGAHGSGPFGDLVRAELARAGVELLLPRTPQADTGHCVVLVEPDGERTFTTAPGVESRLRERALGAVQLRPGDVVYVSGYDLGYPVNGPVMAAWLRALPPEVPLVFDPGPLLGLIPADRLAGVLARTAVLSLNQAEAEALREPGLPGGLAEAGPAVVVVRRGRAGATLVRPGEPPLDLPGRPVAATDTTGAGDVHVGTMLGALAGGASLVDAVRAANRAAAEWVSRAGAR